MFSFSGFPDRQSWIVTPTYLRHHHRDLYSTGASLKAETNKAMTSVERTEKTRLRDMGEYSHFSVTTGDCFQNPWMPKSLIKWHGFAYNQPHLPIHLKSSLGYL